MRDETGRHAPGRIGRPVVQRSQPGQGVGFGVLDAQRPAPAALDQRQLAPALVEADEGRRRGQVGLQFEAVRGRFAVDRQAGIGFGREPDLATLLLQQAELVRPLRQADAVGRATADIVGGQLDPVQADQAGPAIGFEQMRATLRAPGLVFRDEAGIGDVQGAGVDADRRR